MSRDFPGSADFLATMASAPATAYPVTLACWFTCDSLAANRTLLSMGKNSADGYLRLALLQTTGVVRAQIDPDTGGGSTADTSNAITLNKWHFGAAVFRATGNDQEAYLDGSASKGSTGTPITFPSTNRMGLGILRRNTTLQEHSGLIAHATIWNTDLSDDEIDQLANGRHPLDIQPEQIVWYDDLANGTAGVTPLIGVALTETGAVGEDVSPILWRGLDDQIVPASGPGTRTISGTPTLADATPAGTGKIIEKISGVPTLADATPAGTAKIIEKISGALTLGDATPAGNIVIPSTRTISGTPTLGDATPAGIAKIIEKISGAPTLGDATPAGNIVIPSTRTISGTPTLANAVVAGTISIPGLVHVRQQIRDALKTACEAALSEGTVEVRRVRPLEEADSAGTRQVTIITLGTDTLQHQTSGLVGARTQWRVLEVDLTTHRSGDATLQAAEDALDAAEVELVEAIVADATLATKTKSITYEGSAYEFSDDLRRNSGSITTSLRIVYAIRQTTMESLA